MWETLVRWATMGAAPRWIPAQPGSDTLSKFARQASASLASSQALAMAVSTLVAEVAIAIAVLALRPATLDSYRALNPYLVGAIAVSLHVLLFVIVAGIERRWPSLGVRSRAEPETKFVDAFLTVTSNVRLSVTPEIRDEALRTSPTRDTQRGHVRVELAREIERSPSLKRAMGEEITRVFGMASDDALAMAILTHLLGLAAAVVASAGFLRL